jgi:hypothetical protein
MAKRRGRPPKPGPNGSNRLPQRYEVWQLDARRLPEVVVGGTATSPWATVVVSTSEGFILDMRLEAELPGPLEVWALLTEAMGAPESGEPHRPTEVQFLRAEWAEALRPRLDELGVGCEVGEVLEAVDGVIEFFGSKFGGAAETPPGLLDAEGITPEAVGSFFDAAALFYEQAPWKKVGERPIRVECDRLEGGPWYAVLMGQAGMTSGLALYDSLETLDGIQRSDLPPEQTAEMTAGLAVVFGEEDELSPGDVEGAQRHGWRVAGPRAYPSAYRTDPGLQMRPPTLKELHLLEACLRAVPEFVRKKSRRIESTTVRVPTAGGEATVGLSWVGW